MYVPGAAGIASVLAPLEKFPVVPMATSLKVTLWFVPSKLVQVTTALGDTRMSGGLNAVACIDTDLSATALLAALHAIELAHGRERPYRNAPRTLDLDILLYGDAQIDLPALHVPHPRMLERAFVLVPLLEIAPDVSVPGRGLASEFLATVAGQSIAPMCAQPGKRRS